MGVLTDLLLFSQEQIKLAGNKYLKYLNTLKRSVYYIRIYIASFCIVFWCSASHCVNTYVGKEAKCRILFKHSKLQNAYKSNKIISKTLNMNKKLDNKTFSASSHPSNKLHVTQHRGVIHNWLKATLGVFIGRRKLQRFT